MPPSPLSFCLVRIAIRILQRPTGAATQKLTHAFAPVPLLPIHNKLATQKDFLDASCQRVPLKQAVVNTAVLLRGSDGPGVVSIEQYYITIRPNRNGAFLGEEPKQLGRVGRRQCHKAVE